MRRLKEITDDLVASTAHFVEVPGRINSDGLPSKIRERVQLRSVVACDIEHSPDSMPLSDDFSKKSEIASQGLGRT